MAYDVTKQATVGHLKLLAEATKQELDQKQDKGTASEANIATDDEVAEMLNEIFGTTESTTQGE